MTCPRCHGFMILDHFVANKWDDDPYSQYSRCLNCGNCVDTLILHHRIHPPVVRDKRKYTLEQAEGYMNGKGRRKYA